MATGAMGAVVNELQKIIFKWALKINRVVLLTQSPRSCVVNSEGPGVLLLSSWYLTSSGFSDCLQIALQILFEIPTGQSL